MILKRGTGPLPHPSPDTLSLVVAGVQLDTHVSGFAAIREGDSSPHPAEEAFLFSSNFSPGHTGKDRRSPSEKPTLSTTGQWTVHWGACPPPGPDWAVCLNSCHGNDSLWAWVTFLFLGSLALPISFSTFPLAVIWLPSAMWQQVTWKHFTKGQIPQPWLTCGPHIRL